MHPLLTQVPGVGELKSIGELGQLVVIALVALVIAIALVIALYAIIRSQKSASDNDSADRGLLKQMIDLATSYKTESAEARDAYKAEAAATRAVVQESNDTLRGLTHATNEQTGKINEQVSEIKLLRKNFADYQTLNSDTISGLRSDFEGLKKEVLEHVQNLLEISEANAKRHVVADADRVEIHKKLDAILDLVAPPPPPATVTNIINATTTDPATADGSATAEGSEGRPAA